MKIYDRNYKREVTVSEAVYSTIDRAGDTYERIGVVEEVGRKLDKASTIIGFLAGVLEAKGLLTRAEIDEITGFDFTVTQGD